MSNIKDPLNKLEFPSKRKVLQYWPVVCALIIGFMGTYVLWQWINQTEEKQIKEKFIERAEGISSEFERHLVSYEYTLKMLRAVFLASDYVSEEEYEVLSAGILLNRPDIKGVHFIPKVSTKDSPQLSSSPYWYVEDAVKKEGGVKEGQAPLVVQRSVSLDYFESLVGLNMSHYPEFQESIEQSFVENTVVASLPITLFPDVDDIFLYYPLFQKSKNQNLPDRYKNILAQYNADAGFLSLSIKISDFFKNHKEYKGVNIRLYLSDGDGKRVSLHEDGENVDIWHNDVVEMFSKQWVFEYWPNNIEELRGVRNEFIILLSGIALSLFLAIYIGTSIYRKGKDYQLNQTLNQERTYLDSILNNMMQGVVTIDEFGTIITFNKWAEEIFGYGSHEVIAKNVTELMPKKYRERHQAGLDRYLNTGNATILGADLELEGLRKNGDVFP
ncbi:MAG: CHASE domain-containing protein, partial [Bdellovibrionales bacterium]